MLYMENAVWILSFFFHLFRHFTDHVTFSPDTGQQKVKIVKKSSRKAFVNLISHQFW